MEPDASAPIQTEKPHAGPVYRLRLEETDVEKIKAYFDRVDDRTPHFYYCWLRQLTDYYDFNIEDVKACEKVLLYAYRRAHHFSWRTSVFDDEARQYIEGVCEMSARL